MIKIFLNLQFVLVLSLYDVLLAFMLVFQTAVLSVLLIILHKKLDKMLQENRGSIKIFIDRANEILLIITNLSAIVSKNNGVQEESRSNVTDTMPKDSLLVKESHFKSLQDDHNKTLTGNACNSKDNLKDSLGLFSPLPTTHQNSAPPSLPAQTEKAKTGSLVDLENDLERFKDYEDNIHTPKQTELDNRSVKELKSLENEILFALKRLEKTKSHLAE